MPLSALAFAASLPGAWVGAHLPTGSSWLALTPLSGLLAALVQLLGTVIGAFSARYLEGEDGQNRYAAALAGVLASVHLLLLANHWLVLIAAWSLIGVALQHLLCFYGDRPFARLAAHKKRLADRLADVLLLAGALLAWHETGSGSLGDLARYVSAHGASPALQCSAVCLALAVVLRTALLPVHVRVCPRTDRAAATVGRIPSRRCRRTGTGPGAPEPGDWPDVQDSLGSGAAAV